MTPRRAYKNIMWEHKAAVKLHKHHGLILIFITSPKFKIRERQKM